MASGRELNLEIIPYSAAWREPFERFRMRAMSEGNQSLIPAKLNVDTLQGQLLLCILSGEVISASVCEASHYTGDPVIAARICRYHVLEEMRSRFLFCGFRMMRMHCEWADKNGYKVIYFTHDVSNASLNALYRKERKYGFGVDNGWFDDPYFKSFELSKDRLFQVSSKSSMLQFVYVRKTDAQFVWNPPVGMIPMPEEILRGLS